LTKLSEIKKSNFKSGYCSSNAISLGITYFENSQGTMVPMSAFTNIEYSRGPESLNRYNNLPAVKLLGNAAPGYSSGQAIDEVERIAKAVLPPDMTYDWTGSAYQEGNV